MKDFTLAIDTGQLHADYHTSRERAADTFVARINAFVERYKPSRVVCAFDTAGPTFRHELFPGYKADRSVKEAELEVQFDLLLAALFKSGYECVGVAGFEADDIIATVSALSDENVIIFSQDKDCRQLLEQGRVTILRKYNLAISGSREAVWFSAATLLEEYGLTPSQWISYQCLVGDGTDKIVGVTGIGDKRARELLANGRTLQSILDDFDSVTLTPKQRENLTEYKGRHEIVRQLVTLRTDVPL